MNKKHSFGDNLDKTLHSSNDLIVMFMIAISSVMAFAIVVALSTTLTMRG